MLPDKEITATIAKAPQGDRFYYSGAGNDLDNSMTRSATLPAGAVAFKAKVNFQIELDWDYAYLTVNGSSDGHEPLDEHQPERPELW